MSQDLDNRATCTNRIPCGDSQAVVSSLSIMNFNGLSIFYGELVPSERSLSFQPKLLKVIRSYLSLGKEEDINHLFSNRLKKARLVNLKRNTLTTRRKD